MSRQPGFDFRSQLGVLIGLGCPECGGYVTVDLVESRGYQVVCEDCSHEYWITFGKESLEAAAPKLLASCVRLVGIILRDSSLASVGSVQHRYIQETLTAIAEATGYPREFWQQLGDEIKRATQEVTAAPRD